MREVESEIYPMNQDEFFAFVIDVLEELDIPYMITGSVASMAYGEPRMTLDMDIVVDLFNKKAEKFCQKFDENFYKDLDSILEAIRTKDHFNIIHVSSGSKADFYQLKDDPLSQQMFKNRRQESFREDKMAYFSRPEDVIIIDLLSRKQNDKSPDFVGSKDRRFVIDKEKVNNKLIFYKEGKSEKPSG